MVNDRRGKIAQASRAAPSASIWRQDWPLITLLIVLLLGPLIAPLFQATGLPLVSDSGALARGLLSRYVCPTPAKSYVLLGFPMAVCARCWGATIGLWLAWLVFRRPARMQRASQLLRRFRAIYCSIPWFVRLGLTVGVLLLWTLEINAWAGAPLAVLLVNGIGGGFWAGMFFGVLWPAIDRTYLVQRKAEAR
jgi:predicted membrane protein DUF2085